MNKVQKPLTQGSRAQKKVSPKKVNKVQKRKLTTKKLKALKGPFELAPLPYAKDALAPDYSPEAFDYHHGKHHQSYITNLNNHIKGTDLEGKNLGELIDVGLDQKKAGKPFLFNQSAQHFNHAMFWHSMKPGAGGKPSGKLAEQIDKDFGSFDAFREKFKTTAVGHFGSGWAFLSYCPKQKKLLIESLHDAETPQQNGNIAIMNFDVWEHAYYVDYRNARPNFTEAFLTKMVNWEYAAKNFDEAV